MQNQIKKKSSTRTRTGKLRLGPLSPVQLRSEIEKTSSAKEKHRLRKRLVQLEKKGLA